MLISRSVARRALLTVLSALFFISLYETTTLDSRRVVRPIAAEAPGVSTAAAPAPVPFTATAYCKGTTTASGVNVRTGVAAADPDVLPVGSVVHVQKLGAAHDGIYTIMDTGPRVKGRHIDIYMWSCNEALALGRRPALVSVVRLGWNPKASMPSLMERLFMPRKAAPVELPATAVQDAVAR
jgi:3D (Asp-Asp-Asp) domain-containing protein